MKKKAEFVTMKEDIKKLTLENKELKEKVSVFCFDLSDFNTLSIKFFFTFQILTLILN